jgi:hypothetical protein
MADLPLLTVPIYFEQAQHKLRCANLLMDDANLLAIASTAVLAAQHFSQTTYDWEALSAATKMWAEWKIHYRTTHIAGKQQLLTTGGAEPFQGAAHVVTTDASPHLTAKIYKPLNRYLDNLANVAM